MLQALLYNKEQGLKKIEKRSSIKRLLQNNKNLVWLDITDPSEDDIDLMVDDFRFHQLAIEDAIFPQNQPKIDDYNDYLFVVLHEMSYPRGKDLKVKAKEVNIFIGKNYLLTIHSAPLPSISKLFQLCLNDKVKAMQRDSGFLLHAVIDNIVDGYFPVVEQMENYVENVEDRVLEGAEEKLLETIVDLKKSVLTMRNFIVPQRRIVGSLGRAGTPFIKPTMSAYFRDVYDHIERVNNMLDTYHNMLNSTMDAYLSMVSHRLNAIMKTLTIITTIMMPMTLITSFYGMNVNIPEFGWGIKGYFFVIGLLILAISGMIIFLKHRKWI